MSLRMGACAVVALALGVPLAAAAQDVAITNVRIVVGTGQVIESGTIIVRGGTIASVTPGAAPAQGLRVIDAKGLSAMPGFIDSHKHVNDGPDAKGQMQSLLEAGYTTILSGGSNGGADVALRDKIEKGEYNGPRIIPSVRIPLQQTPAEARAAMQAMVAKGIKHTAEIGLTPEPAPPQAEIEVLKAIVDEAKKAGVQVNVHAVSTPAMVAAVDAGVTRLVHLPNKDWTSLRGRRGGGEDRIDRRRADRVWRADHRPRVARAGVVQFPRDNTTRFRDGKPWPEAIAGANRDPKGRAMGTEAGYTIVNARRIWDADPNHQTIRTRPIRTSPTSRCWSTSSSRTASCSRWPTSTGSWGRTRRATSAWRIASARSRPASSPTSSCSTATRR